MAKFITPERFHPEITGFPIVKLDIQHYRLTYSGESAEFYEIPTDFLLKNADRRELWEKGCPPLVNYDMLKCIEEVIAAGKYPYNSTVGELFCQKNNILYQEHSFIGSMVYCTQQYRHVIEREHAAKQFHEKVTSMGYLKSTDELLQTVLSEKKKCLVVIGTDEANIIQDKPMKLVVDSAGTLFFMPQRATRRGYHASRATYIKPI